jgi:hypothetical protein
MAIGADVIGAGRQVGGLLILLYGQKYKDKNIKCFGMVEKTGSHLFHARSKPQVRLDLRCDHLGPLSGYSNFTGSGIKQERDE